MEDKITAKLESVLNRTNTLAYTNPDEARKIRGEVSEVLFLLKMKAKGMGC